MNKPPYLTDPSEWFIRGTPQELAAIPTYDTRDDLPVFEEVDVFISQPGEIPSQYIGKYTHIVYHLPWEGLETEDEPGEQDVNPTKWDLAAERYETKSHRSRLNAA